MSPQLLGFLVQILYIAVFFITLSNFFVKPVLILIHQGCIVRLSSDGPGCNEGERFDLDRPLFLLTAVSRTGKFPTRLALFCAGGQHAW